jgi:hypothetical protein
MSIFMPVTNCFGYCHFAVYFQDNYCSASSFVLHAEDCFVFGQLLFPLHLSRRLHGFLAFIFCNKSNSKVY